MYKDIIINYGTELKNYTGADLVENDTDAYRIVYRTPWDLTGCTVKALCKRADGTVVSGMGFAEGTNAVFVMDSSMYAVPGELTVRLTVCTAEEQVITVCDVTANAVESFGDGIPGTNSKTVLDQILINVSKMNTALEEHTADKSNPHAVTKAQVGLENVDNAKQATKAEFDEHTSAEVIDHPDGSVTEDKIADGAVTENKILGKAVTTAKIADGAINENKLNTALKTKLNGKADKGTKLSDYGIADAYTKSEADMEISKKANADDVYTKAQTDTKLYAKENTANKVTEISGTSTDEQYPSAKAVNDTVKAAGNNFANALKGKKTGSAIYIDDISPLEHHMNVKISGVSDPASVTVSKYGKNLFNKKILEFADDNKLTKTINDDGTYKLSGAITKQSYSYYGKKPFFIPKNTKVTISSRYDVIPANDEYNLGLVLYDKDSNILLHGNSLKHGQHMTATLTVDCAYVAIVYRCAGASVGDDITFDNIELQLELGDGTDYEDYIEAVSYTVSSSGTVDNVINSSPDVTLIADNNAALIDAEYNRDINKAFEELQNAILSQGGNV